jgi:hypothetical protein
MTWFYKDRPVEDDDIKDQIGFVYVIENLSSGKKYIGKKLLKFSRTKTVKGKRKKVKVDSDWQTYYGSNNALNADVEKLGVNNFRRTILHLCKSKGTANFLEAKEQILNNVLESDNWYNDQIRVRVHRSHLKL